MEKPYWEGKEFSFFSHKECEYFPCHKGADPEEFNCLFCMHWEKTVVEISLTQKTDIRTAQTVLCRISVKITGTLQENIRNSQKELRRWTKNKSHGETRGLFYLGQYLVRRYDTG